MGKVPGTNRFFFDTWTEHHLEQLIDVLERQNFQYDWSVMRQINELSAQSNLDALLELVQSLDIHHKEYAWAHAVQSDNADFADAVNEYYNSFVDNKDVVSPIDAEWYPALTEYIIAFRKENDEVDIQGACMDAHIAYLHRKINQP